MAAFQSLPCRLCINICNDHLRLYDEDGRRNEAYALTEKYFSSVLLKAKYVGHVAVICRICWRHISQFHTFQQSVLQAQKMCLITTRCETVVKSEVESQLGEEEFISDPLIATAQHLTYASCSKFSQDRVSDSSKEDNANQQSLAIVNSEGPLNDDSSSEDEDANQQLEATVKSEVEYMEYTITEVLQAREVLTKNSGSNIFQDPGPVTDFTGGEFLKQEHETTDSESERSDGCFSSDEEIPLAVQNRKVKAEPNMGNPSEVESITATSSTTPGRKANIKFEYTVFDDNSNSHDNNFKQEFNVSESDSEGSGGDFSSDDEISLEEAKRGNQEGVEPIRENLPAQHDESPQSKAKPKHKRRNRITYKSNFKQPQTVQEYDDLIVQWRPNLECVICSESCSSYSLLQQHFDKHHSSEECHIICCQIKFYHRHELAKHIRFHLEPNAFKCEQCYKCFTSRDNLMMHMRSIHSGKPKISYKCPKCLKSYSKKKLLTNHMKYSCDADNKLTSEQGSKGQGHTCEECGKVYKILSSLRRHMRKAHLKSTEIVTLKCTICDQVCTSSLDLREHMGKHTGKPLYTCPFCPKSVIFRASLYEHLNREHRKEWEEKKKEKLGGSGKRNTTKAKKIHKCTICEKVFQRLHSLREHQAKHEGKALYTCTHCAQTFNYRTRLSEHLKKEHSEEQTKMKKD